MAFLFDDLLWYNGILSNLMDNSLLITGCTGSAFSEDASSAASIFLSSCHFC